MLAMVPSRREHRRQMDEYNDWRNALYDDGGIWATEEVLRSWVLDETEGPYRVRYVDFYVYPPNSSVDAIVTGRNWSESLKRRRVSRARIKSAP